MKKETEEELSERNQVMKDLLEKIEREFKLVTPQSACCNAPTYVTTQGTICTSCGQNIQTTLT